MSDDEFSFSLETFRYLVLDLHNLLLWLPAFVLAVLLRFITQKYHHQLIFPLCESHASSPRCDPRISDDRTDFITIPVIFYIVVAIARLDLTVLRSDGWLFEMDTADEPWYKFYTLYGMT